MPFLYNPKTGSFAQNNCKDTMRMPDFISVSASVPIYTPWTGPYLSWSFSGTVDRYGHFFWSPIGPGAGRAFTGLSVSLTGNWLGTKCKPTSSQLSNFLTGHGFTGSVGFWGGGNFIYSPGNGSAGGFGLVTPQIGGNYSYSFRGAYDTILTW